MYYSLSKLAISGCHFCKGFQIHITKEHENWLTVRELIRNIRKPISIYVDEIVKAFHEKLCKDLIFTLLTRFSH